LAVPNSVEAALLQVIETCLKDADQRPTFKALTQMPYLSDVRFEDERGCLQEKNILPSAGGTIYTFSAKLVYRLHGRGMGLDFDKDPSLCLIQTDLTL
jgi:hypothetical protein